MTADAALWDLVDRLIAEGRDVSWLASRRLAALVAERRFQQHLAIGDGLRQEARQAVIRQVVAEELLAEVRAVVSGRLLVLKGPELARCYPRQGLRSFADLDVLADDAARASHELVQAGFVVRSTGTDYRRHHHVAPLQRRPTPMLVEVHRRPSWVSWSPAPTAELLAAAHPSRTGVSDLERPDDAHHAVLVAVHAWRARPYGQLRDLVDLWLLVEGAGPGPEAAAAVAEAWDVGRLWRSTWAAVEALVAGSRRPPLGLRLLGRHLDADGPASRSGSGPARVTGALVICPPRALWRRIRRSTPLLDQPAVE